MNLTLFAQSNSNNMQEVFQYIILALLLGSVVLSIMNYIELKKIKDVYKQEYSDDVKELYLQLKMRVQMYATIAGIVTAIIAFWGFNAQDKIDKAISDEVSKSTKEYRLKVDSLTHSFDSLQTCINSAFVLTGVVDSTSKGINKTLNLTTKDFLRLSNQVQIMEKRISLNTRISYTIGHKMRMNFNSDDYQDKLFFKDLIENYEPLTRTPYVMVYSDDFGLFVMNVNLNSFEIGYNGFAFKDYKINEIIETKVNIIIFY